MSKVQQWLFGPYKQISCGGTHTVLLRGDGTAIADGCKFWGQCAIPPLEQGVTYIQVSAGHDHTVLLRSDGRVVAIGHNLVKQCEVHMIGESADVTYMAKQSCVSNCSPPGVTYVQISAGYGTTVLLRNDGAVVACGWNNSGHQEPIQIRCECVPHHLPHHHQNHHHHHDRA